MAFQDSLIASLDRVRPGSARALLFGLVCASAAIALRVAIGPEIGRDQIIFSYPAVILATLLFGTGAGAAAAVTCLLVAWYLVIPYRDSFALRDIDSVITLAVYVIVSGSLVAAIGTMRTAILGYRRLAASLDATVQARTAERNRLWERGLEAIVVIEGSGKIRSANPAFLRMIGETAAGLIGTAFEGRVAAEDRDTAHAALAALGLGDQASATFEVRMSSGNGPLAIAWSAVRDDGTIYLVGRDVTVERACSEQLHQTQRMDVIGQMTGGLAHDFANLLNPVQMGLGLLRRRHGADPASVELFDMAEDSAQRAGLLVRRLLAFSRREPGEETETDVADQLLQVLPMLRQALGSRSLVTEIPDDAGWVSVSANELEVALLNLALNARDASAPESEVVLAAQAAGGEVAISITDRGAGMDDETRAQAIEPFFTTKPVGEGSGLGLTMVSEFVTRHGGRLEITSEPGHGTTVGMRLPALKRD